MDKDNQGTKQSLSNFDIKARYNDDQKEIWSKTLDVIENAFIALSVPDGIDSELYQNVRKKILRIGNNKIRDFESFLKGYKVYKINKIYRDEIQLGNSYNQNTKG